MDTLAGDGVGIDERLVTASGFSRAVAAEILVVDKRRPPVRANKIDVAGVNAIGDIGNLDAGAGDAKGARRLGLE